jgi:hypothetical protein
MKNHFHAEHGRGAALAEKTVGILRRVSFLSGLRVLGETLRENLLFHFLRQRGPARAPRKTRRTKISTLEEEIKR